MPVGEGDTVAVKVTAWPKIEGFVELLIVMLLG
jgi:hypothetical protein